MARVNRREVLAEGEIQVVHCVNRCVRRGFLCGTDELTGKDHEHRRQWIRNRLEFLAGVFAIDVMGFSVMPNHLHAILRNRPDVLKTWSDEEVVRRWWNLFPSRRTKNGSPAEPAETDLKSLMADAKVLAELKARLSSVSWFMRCTSEVIARMASAEEECTGRFWQARYRAVRLLDETAILACAAYVDLNPIRAALAGTIEDSDFTSAQKRCHDMRSRHAAGSKSSQREQSPGDVNVASAKESVDRDTGHGRQSRVGDTGDNVVVESVQRGSRHLAPVELQGRSADMHQPKNRWS